MTDSDGSFSAEERAAITQRSREVRAGRKRASQGEDRAGVLAAIAGLSDDERHLAERVYSVVCEAAPELAPRTWYGSPAWAKDGAVLVFFQPGSKFGVRYATLGFTEIAQLDDGSMWPTSYAIAAMSPDVERRIAALVRRAVG